MANTTGKDLTKEAPRSPHEKVGGYVILGRAIDKCRALLWGTIGEYNFDCPLDNFLFSFKGVTGDDFKSYVREGHSDDEIAEWISFHGDKKTEAEIKAWNEKMYAYDYADNSENKEWLEGENTRLCLNKDATLFAMLDADDKASFKR